MDYIPDRKPGGMYRVSAGVAAGIIAAVLALGIVIGVALPAGATTDISDKNKPGYWGDDCFKIESGFSGSSWTADDDYRLVVLKSAKVNDQFPDVSDGETVKTVSGKDISHIILCTGDDDDDDSSGSTTTTTEPEQSTTTTTQPEQSTTTTTEPEQSTTTTQPESTTTTQPRQSTTTTEQSTTTTGATSTTDDPPPIDAPPVTTPPQDTPDELPFTGAESLYWALAGFAALVIGGGALVAERRVNG